jgi:hypothetical protein
MSYLEESVDEADFDIADAERCVMGHAEIGFAEEILEFPLDGKYYTTNCRRWLDLPEHGDLSCIWRDLVTASRETIPTKAHAIGRLHMIYDLATNKEGDT